MSLLRVDDLDVRYGPIPALRGVELQIDAGEFVVVLGANGAGKTSLLRTIAGALKPRGGTITFEGRRINGLRPPQIVELGVVLVPEGRQIFGRLSVRDNLQLGGFAKRARQRARQMQERVFSLFPQLKEREQQLAGTLSGGEQQMLAIGRGLMGNPRLLMLDEPSMGLSPVITKTIYRALKNLNEDFTILAVEQNVVAALGVASRGYVLDSGAVAAEGSAEILRAHVQAAYLGSPEPIEK